MRSTCSGASIEPVGLCGEFSTMTRVRSVIAASIAAGVGWNPGSVSAIVTCRAPARPVTAA